MCCSLPCFCILLCTHYEPFQCLPTAYFCQLKKIGVLRLIFSDYIISRDCGHTTVNKNVKILNVIIKNVFPNYTSYKIIKCDSKQPRKMITIMNIDQMSLNCLLLFSKQKKNVLRKWFWNSSIGPQLAQKFRQLARKCFGQYLVVFLNSAKLYNLASRAIS